MALLLISKALGFVRESMIAARYGAGFVSDLYVFEDGLINAIYTVFAGVISTTYIPKATSLDKKERSKFTNNYMTILLIAIILIAISFIIFTPWLLKILVPGFYKTYDVIVLDRIITITRINLISLIFVFIENYYIAILQSHNYFVFSSIQGIILNISLIVYLAFFFQYEVEGIIFIKCSAHILNILILVFFLLRKDIFSYRPMIDIHSNHLKDVVRLAMPVFFVNLVSQLNYIVDRSMASRLDTGSMAILSYSNTIASLLYSVIGVSVCQIAYTDISEKQKDEKLMEESFERYYCMLLTTILPCAIVFLVDSREISSLVFERGKLDSGEVLVLSKVLICYIPSNVAMSLRDIYNRLLYIHKKTSIPSSINFVGLITNIILNAVLTSIIGVYGLAIATSLSSGISLVVTVLFCKRIAVINKKLYFNIFSRLVVAVGLSIGIYHVMCHDNILGKILVVFVTFVSCMIVFNINHLPSHIRGMKK